MAREVGGSRRDRRPTGALRVPPRGRRAPRRGRREAILDPERRPLGVAAPWLLLLVLASRPETLDAYDSAAGTALILTGVAVTIVAYRLMLGLGRLPEERRWLH